MNTNLESNDLSPQQILDFKNTFKIITDRILDEIKDPELFVLKEWVKTVYDSNVTSGKQYRAKFFIKTHQLIAQKMGKQLSEEQTNIANVIGWAFEMAQAFALMLDDIMDGSETRRGRLCWYKQVSALIANIDNISNWAC